MTIDVVAPSQVYHEYTQDDPRSGIANNLVGYGVIDNVYLKPVDVSFHLISFGEGTSLADGTGVYLPKKNLLHQASGPIAMLMGNSVKGTQLNGTDTVFNGGVPRNGGVGQFIWVIPQQYFSDDGNRINIQNGDLSHIATFDGNQTIRIQKGGVDRSGPP